VVASERIRSLDVLRGFAVLGILIMNIQSFASIGAAYMNPFAYGSMEGANRLVWLLSHLLADAKLMTIFSILFGAGIVLMMERQKAAGRPAVRVHLRRMVVLLAFGIAHGYLLWYGDILHGYAVCGLVVFLLRRRSIRTLLILGVLAVGVASAIGMLWQVTMPYWPEEAVTDMEQTWWQPSEEAITAELEGYRAGWLDQQSRRVADTFFMQTWLLLTDVIWRAGGLMLIGMALYRLGVLSAGLSARSYRLMAAIGFLTGLPVVGCGVYFRFQSGWDVRSALFLGSQFNYWASIPVALAWIAVVMLICKSGSAWAERIRRPLASAGQMALSCYLLQTIICTTIFYGHGLALFGRVDRVGQILIVVAVWTVLLIFSTLWLRHFRFGPFEWLWRSMTYMKLQPMRVDRQ
jgi:uncharacterized protein